MAIISYNLHNKETSSIRVTKLVKVLEQVDAELRLEPKSVWLNCGLPALWGSVPNFNVEGVDFPLHYQEILRH